jgi:hypothetical protein
MTPLLERKLDVCKKASQMLDRRENGRRCLVRMEVTEALSSIDPSGAINRIITKPI